MINIKTFVHNPFQENTYLLWDESSSCILVDPGSYLATEKEEVLNFIRDHNLVLQKLVCTHGHIDHILGSSFFSEIFKVSLEYHPEEKYLIEHAQEYAENYGFTFDKLPYLAPILMEGGEVSFGNSRLEVFHVPGHSKGSVALFSPDDRFVLVGDVLFKQSIGRTDLPGGDYDILMQSISQKLLSLPPKTIVYPGHGPATTIAEELEQNDFIVDFLKKV